MQTDRASEEIAAIASMAGGPHERARALIESLRAFGPFDAASVMLYDPVGRRQVPLAQHGYPDRVHRHMESAQFARDLEMVGLSRHVLPTRNCDVPYPVRTIPVWRDFLYPAGFTEGYGAGLFTADGRFLGALVTHTESGPPLSDRNRLLLYDLIPVIAHALDPLRTVAALADVVADAVAGVVLTTTGQTVSLGGLPGHPLLAAGSPVVAAALGLLGDGQVSGAFLSPDDGPAGLVRITALACPPQPPGHLRALLLVSPRPATDLTRRELQVLGLVIEGWSNARIAAGLHVTLRTAISHIEHIMLKLAASSRTVAAMRAVRTGLYIPASLGVGISSDTYDRRGAAS